MVVLVAIIIDKESLPLSLSIIYILSVFLLVVNN